MNRIALDKSGFKMILKYILWKCDWEAMFLSGLDVENVHSEKEKGTVGLSLLQLKVRL